MFEALPLEELMQGLPIDSNTDVASGDLALDGDQLMAPADMTDQAGEKRSTFTGKTLGRAGLDAQVQLTSPQLGCTLCWIDQVEMPDAC